MPFKLFIEKFDIYISTGGPGNPLEGNGNWDLKYYDFIDSLTEWNKEHKIKKHVLFICHSFQMACKHFGLAEITKRKDTSFGYIVKRCCYICILLVYITGARWI